MKIFIYLLLFVNLVAQDDYSFRVAYGKVNDSDLGEILYGDWKEQGYDLRVLSFDAGYLLNENTFDMPLDIYLKGGLSYFDESDYFNKYDVYEATIYVKAYWNFDFLDNRVRLGLGEGLSYTTNILICEYLEATEKEDNYSKLLNYLDISLDFDIGRLLNHKPLYGTYIGYAIKHRSGIFGLINDVSHGGSNYNTLFIEKNF